MVLTLPMQYILCTCNAFTNFGLEKKYMSNNKVQSVSLNDDAKFEIITLSPKLKLIDCFLLTANIKVIEISSYTITF